MKTKLSFVIPCYCSEKTIGTVVDEIRKTVITRKEQYDYEIILVSDHSPDNVFSVIEELANSDKNITGIELAKNFGQHSAILAGFHHVTGDNGSKEKAAFPALKTQVEEHALDEQEEKGREQGVEELYRIFPLQQVGKGPVCGNQLRVHASDVRDPAGSPFLSISIPGEQCIPAAEDRAGVQPDQMESP